MIKAFFKWVYDWVTVITASLVGLPALVLSLLSNIGVVDLTPLVGPQRALQIVTVVALVKGVCAFLLTLKKPAV